jgi:hypothetical protein
MPCVKKEGPGAEKQVPNSGSDFVLRSSLNLQIIFTICIVSC